jgi:uncharacterized protein involved in exopolysaccharide biosynthesis
MRRRSILALAVFVLVIAPMIALAWTCVVPEYQAGAEVRVRPFIPHLVFQTEDNGLIPFYDSYVNTQVSIVRSPTVLQRVLDEPQVLKTQWYKNPSKSLKQRLWSDPVPPLERLRDTLRVQARDRTEIIDVTFTDPNAKDARIIVDTVLDEYMRYIGEMSNENEEKLHRQLIEQYQSLENAIRGQERIIAALRKSLSTVSAEELICRKRLRLDDTQARLSELQQSIALLEWEKQHVVADDNNDVLVSAIDVPATPVDLNGSLHAEKAISVDYQLARAQKEEQLLRAELEKQRTEFNELFETAQLLEKENNDLKHKRDLFNAVRQRLDQKNMERNVRDVIATIEVLTRAFVPSEPHRDRRTLFTAIALVVGLGLSSGVVFLPGRRRKQ